MNSTHVLLIEDNLGDAFLIKNFLHQTNNTKFDIVHVDSLSASFEHLKQTSFDVALLDLSLPDSHGIDTLLEFQLKSPNLPIVVLTGLDSDIIAHRLVRHGAQDYLIKEKINATWLASAIKHAIARFKGIEERYQQEKSSQQELKKHVDAYQHEILQLDKQLQTLEELSATDALTRIANRYYFQKNFERDWCQSCKNSQPISLILLDLDYFKQFNDSCGHPKGDDCLRQVAQSLKQTLKRSTDLVARYGGEEFIVLLPNTPKSGAIEVAAQLRSGVNGLAIRHPNSTISSWVTASFGVASMVPTSMVQSSELIEYADQALYFSKKNGRDRIAYFQAPNFFTQPTL